MLLFSDASLVDRLRDHRAKSLAEIECDQRLIEELFLLTVSRYPNEREQERAAQHLKHASDRVEAVVDLLWGLITTREFLTNH